jgi:hypothetical protein
MPRSAPARCGACSRTKAYAPRAPRDRRRLAACLASHATLFSIDVWLGTRPIQRSAVLGSLGELTNRIREDSRFEVGFGDLSLDVAGLDDASTREVARYTALDDRSADRDR